MGVASQALAQIGTQTACDGKGDATHAHTVPVWSLAGYPKSRIHYFDKKITFAAGDLIDADVTQLATGDVRLALVDRVTGDTVVQIVTPAQFKDITGSPAKVYAPGTAECILERPPFTNSIQVLRVLPKFTKATFTDCTAVGTGPTTIDYLVTLKDGPITEDPTTHLLVPVGPDLVAPSAPPVTAFSDTTVQASITLDCQLACPGVKQAFPLVPPAVTPTPPAANQAAPAITEDTDCHGNLVCEISSGEDTD